MATGIRVQTRPPNYNGPRLNDDSEYALSGDYARQDTNPRDSSQYPSDNTEKQSFQCCFCQKFFPTSMELSGHFMLCGNKTDQCPKCQRYIRRAIFAYHYENECADLEETDRPVSSPRNSSARQHSLISIRSELHDNGDTSSKNRHRILNEVLPSRSTLKDRSPNTAKVKSSYDRHENEENKKNDSENTFHSNQQSGKASRASNNERSTEEETYYIPCEWCNQSIESSEWSSHTKHCSDNDARRIATLAKEIEEKPFIEQIQCKYCEKVFPRTKLEFHESICEDNPKYRIQKSRPVSGNPSLTVTRTNESIKTYGQTTPSSKPLTTHVLVQSTSIITHNNPPDSVDTLEQQKHKKSTNTLNNQHISSHVHINGNRNDNIETPRSNHRPPVDNDKLLTARERRRSYNLENSLMNSDYDTTSNSNLSQLTIKTRASSAQPLGDRSNRRASLNQPLESPRRLSDLQSRQSLCSIHSVDARGSNRSSARGSVCKPTKHSNNAFQGSGTEDLAHRPKILSNKNTKTTQQKQPWR